MNHNVNANKMVSDTPRTDEAVWDEHDPFAAVGHLCRTMERELAAVTQERDALAARIKRLEEAGDTMASAYRQICYDAYDDQQVDNWFKAKEAKP
jgi:cytochrome c556